MLELEHLAVWRLRLLGCVFFWL